MWILWQLPLSSQRVQVVHPRLPDKGWWLHVCAHWDSHSFEPFQSLASAVFPISLCIIKRFCFLFTESFPSAFKHKRSCFSHLQNKNMDLEGKLKKSDRERQISYGFTYTWNLKNKQKIKLIDTEDRLVVAWGRKWEGRTSAKGVKVVKRYRLQL